MGAHVSGIAQKFRRALRNETGTKFTLDELRALVDIGSYDAIIKAEAEEIKSKWEKTLRPASSATTGSTSGATVHRPKFGRSPITPANQGPLSIAALSKGL